MVKFLSPIFNTHPPDTGRFH